MSSEKAVTEALLENEEPITIVVKKRSKMVQSGGR